MNSFGYFILRKAAKCSLLRETYSKSKVILRSFASINENLKNAAEVETIKNNDLSLVKLIDTSKHDNSTLSEITDERAAKWNITRENFDSDEYLHGFDPVLPKPLEECKEDLSHVGPHYVPSFNFAAYVDRSPTLQKLCDMGVNLYKIEMKPKKAQCLLNLEFEKDIKPYIQFLHDCGLLPEQFGAFITKNPEIFLENLDDLKTRIRYLRAHAYNREMITRIVTHDPFWLMFSTKRIDARLGYFQAEFKLSGSQVRTVSAKQPQLITFNMQHIKENTFAVKEEMGFDALETKRILLNRPIIWMRNRKAIVSAFDYLHNTMKIPHTLLSKQPHALLSRRSRIDERHRFLVELGKAQYDPEKPLYISPKTLVSGTDVDFCLNVAKVPIETYNLFLKTL